MTEQTAAIIAEPIQGEGGVRPLSSEFAAAIERACERTGALLIADEVQCGLGRTGEPFYSPVLGLTPDLMSIGKALGSGVPIGAALVSEPVASQIFAGDHGSTYGGNLLSTRAGLYVLEQLTGTAEAVPYVPPAGLIGHVREMSSVFEHALNRLAAEHDIIASARGVGVMRALELTGRCRSSRRRRPESWTAGQSHGGTRGSTPATAQRDESGDRRSCVDPGRRAVDRAGRGDDMNAALVTSSTTLPRRRDGRLQAARSVGCRHLSLGRAIGCANSSMTLIQANLEEGHLLPRPLDELVRPRAAVCRRPSAAVAWLGCAELAPLGARVAEVRSLVVDRSARAHGIGRALLTELQRRARLEGFETLCAFTHDAGYFVRRGYSIVPHAWVPEKIALDCQGVPAVPPMWSARGGAAASRTERAAARELRTARFASWLTMTTLRAPAVSAIDGGITAPRGFRASGHRVRHQGQRPA